MKNRHTHTSKNMAYHYKKEKKKGYSSSQVNNVFTFSNLLDKVAILSYQFYLEDMSRKIVK